MLPIAPIIKPIGQSKTAMRKNATWRYFKIVICSKTERKLCKMTPTKKPMAGIPVNIKNNFNFPFTFDFNVK